MGDPANFPNNAHRRDDLARDASIEELKARLLTVGYPWPEGLMDKSRSWLETEIRMLTAASRDEAG
jgi:hypothetical protein